jgi:hypothetical protein
MRSQQVRLSYEPGLWTARVMPTIARSFPTESCRAEPQTAKNSAAVGTFPRFFFPAAGQRLQIAGTPARKAHHHPAVYDLLEPGS